MVRSEEKQESTAGPEDRGMSENISNLIRKILEGIKQKEEAGRKDKSVKVETKTGLFVRITRNQEQAKFYLSIGPKGGHPVYNKIIFDSSGKLKEFLSSLENFIREREDVLLALDILNKKSEKKVGDTV